MRMRRVATLMVAAGLVTAVIAATGTVQHQGQARPGGTGPAASATVPAFREVARAVPAARVDAPREGSDMRRERSDMPHGRSGMPSARSGVPGGRRVVQ